MPIRSVRGKIATITATAVLAGTIAGLSLGAESFAAGPTQGSQVPGSAVCNTAPTCTAGLPFSSGQIMKVVIPANSVFASGASIKIIECAKAVTTATTDTAALRLCDGLTANGDTVLAGTDGSFTYTNQTMYALPDSLNLGEGSASTPKCDAVDPCVLYIGTDSTHPFSSPHFFSQTFTVKFTAGDTGANPGDGSALAAQTITFTSTPPSPALVGGSYTPMATGGDRATPSSSPSTPRARRGRARTRPQWSASRAPARARSTPTSRATLSTWQRRPRARQ